MSTRFSNLTSQRAKQKLVHLLFSHQYTGKGYNHHRKLDGAAYTFSKIRNAYLQRLQEIHPDKHYKNNVIVTERPENNMRLDGKSPFDLNGRFVELQDAWDQYETIVRTMKKGGNAIDVEANFTMFGVGCSFADSPQERERRNEITEQACRGWFSAGAVCDINDLESNRKQATTVSLCDDDMFVSILHETTSVDGELLQRNDSMKQRKKRHSLIDDMVRSKSVFTL